MSDYVPPGLGRVLEDLISKHVVREKKPLTALDVHIRHAAETRRLMAAMQAQFQTEPAQAKPVQQERLPKTSRRPKHQGKGRAAYEWAVANGKSATEAARHFGINPLLIHTHKRHYGLPPLVDARVTTGKCKRVRRRNAEVKAACQQAFDLAWAGTPPREAANRFGLTFQSLIRFCVRNKFKLPY